MKVMIVDDELPIREWLKMSMENMGGTKGTVLTAGNGREAWEMFRREQPDFVITDIRMPKLSGLELLEKIRNYSQDTYVVMLTSYEEFQYAREAIKFQANEYILKNEITAEVLCQLVVNYNENCKGKVVSKERFYIKDLLEGEDTEDFPILKNEGETIFAVAFAEKESDRAFDLYLNTFVQRIEHCYYKENISVWICSCKKERSDGACFGEAMSFCQNLSALKETSVGFSGFTKDPKRGCLRAVNALNLEFYEMRRAVFLYEEVSEVGSEDIKNMRKKTVSMINKERQEEARDCIWELYKAAGAWRITNLDLLKACFLDIVDAYKVSRLEFGGQELEELCMESKESLNAAGNFTELGEIMERYLLKLNGTMIIGEKNYSSYVKAAMAYVVNNYAHIESLSEVADYVNINPDYFSRLFKSETGITFNGYLTNYRIQKAVELLTKKELKVYEVAEKVGYSNLSYFSRVFKKVTGENPFSFKN